LLQLELREVLAGRASALLLLLPEALMVRNACAELKAKADRSCYIAP
jgi:hypothetical protein